MGTQLTNTLQPCSKVRAGLISQAQRSGQHVNRCHRHYRNVKAPNLHAMEGTFRSTIDMGRGSSNRDVSKKYVTYLHQWDGQQRRLKKTVASAPAVDARPEPGYLNGVKVARKGRGQPPAEKKEQLWSTNGRKEVQGRSHASSPHLLSSTPTTEHKILTVDETRTRFMRKATSRFNQSSMSGASMMVAESGISQRPCRAQGVNNPGWGLSEHMSKTLAYTGEPHDDSPRAGKRLLWTVAALPNTSDSIIRHHDSTTEIQPAKLAARLVTPAHRSVNLEESRSAFMGSLSGYAKNAVRGHYGDFTVRSCGGLAALAGY